MERKFYKYKNYISDVGSNKEVQIKDTVLRKVVDTDQTNLIK